MNGGNWTIRMRWLTLALLGLALAQTQPAPTPPPAGAAPSEAAPVAPASADPVVPDPAAPAPTSTDTAPAVQEFGSSVSLTRTAKDGSKRLITVVRTGLTDATGIFVSCDARSEDPPGTPTISVFSETGPGGVRVTIDKNLIVAPLSLVTQKEGGDGHIEVSAGTARFLDDPPPGASDQLSRCAVEATPKTLPDTVNVTQGKTQLKGSKLVYDDSDGVARINGPITFSRQNKNSTLTGGSSTIEVNVDDKTTTLVGNVTLKDGDRTSSAGRVEYDDAANVAILTGTPDSPAVSVTPDQTLTASVIRYNLDTGSVVAVGPIGGEFQDSDPIGAPTQDSGPQPRTP